MIEVELLGNCCNDWYTVEVLERKKIEEIIEETDWHKKALKMTRQHTRGWKTICYLDLTDGKIFITKLSSNSVLQRDSHLVEIMKISSISEYPKDIEVSDIENFLSDEKKILFQKLAEDENWEWEEIQEYLCISKKRMLHHEAEINADEWAFNCNDSFFDEADIQSQLEEIYP